jgi:hypothetical protein
MDIINGNRRQFTVMDGINMADGYMSNFINKNDKLR